MINTFVISAVARRNTAMQRAHEKKQFVISYIFRMSAATSLVSCNRTRNIIVNNDITRENGSVSVECQSKAHPYVGRMKLRVQFSAKVNGNPAVLTESNVVAL